MAEDVTRRALGGLTLAAGVTLAAGANSSACKHDFVCVGAYGRDEHRHYACRACRAEKIHVTAAWSWDERPRGWLSLRSYRDAYGPLPARSKIDKAIAVHL